MTPVVAFLVKFNPAVESLDFSEIKNLKSKWRQFHVTPILQSDVIMIGIPASIGDCSALTTLNLYNTKIESE